MHFGLVHYGQLDFPSGGFLYDRKLVDHLQAQGHRVSLFSQAWSSFLGQLSQNWHRDFLNSILDTDLDLLIQDELNHASLFRLNRALKRRSELPIVSLVHHLRISEKERGGPIRRTLERAYLRSVDAFLVNSATTAETLKPWINAEVALQIAQPGGDRLGSLDDQSRIRQRALDAGPLRLLFVGSLTPRKQPHLILEAMAQLPRNSVRATFAGDLESDLPYVRQLRSRIEALGLDQHVRLLGHIKPDELKHELSENQVFLLPSSYEGFGIAYLEALAYGLPAIGLARAGAAEIIEHGRSGFLLQRSDSAELAQRLAAMAEDRDRLAEMSIAARSRFDQFPTWDESMRLAEDFLVGLAKGKN